MWWVMSVRWVVSVVGGECKMGAWLDCASVVVS